jgi:hypothetical protein
MDSKFEKFLILKKADVKNPNFSWIDFNENSSAMKCFTQQIELEKTETSNIKKSILEKIEELSSNKPDDIIKSFTFNSDEYKELDDLQKSRKLITKILNAINYVAANGRIGPAKTMIISEKNYKKYNLEKNFIYDIEIIFEDINDIYLYRKNEIDQSGIFLCYYTDENNNDFYEIFSIGLHPENQFLKIKMI